MPQLSAKVPFILWVYRVPVPTWACSLSLHLSVINGGGFLGSAIGLGIPNLFNADKGYALGLLTGGIIGTVSAIKLTGGLDFVGTKNSMASFALIPWFGIAPTDSGAVRKTYSKLWRLPATSLLIFGVPRVSVSGEPTASASRSLSISGSFGHLQGVARRKRRRSPFS